MRLPLLLATWSFFNIILPLVSLITWLISFSVFWYCTKWALTVSSLHPLVLDLSLTVSVVRSVRGEWLVFLLLLGAVRFLGTCCYGHGPWLCTVDLANESLTVLFHLAPFAGERCFMRSAFFKLSINSVHCPKSQNLWTMWNQGFKIQPNCNPSYTVVCVLISMLLNLHQFIVLVTWRARGLQRVAMVEPPC